MVTLAFLGEALGAEEGVGEPGTAAPPEGFKLRPSPSPSPKAKARQKARKAKGKQQFMEEAGRFLASVSPTSLLPSTSPPPTLTTTAAAEEAAARAADALTGEGARPPKPGNRMVRRELVPATPSSAARDFPPLPGMGLLEGAAAPGVRAVPTAAPPLSMATRGLPGEDWSRVTGGVAKEEEPEVGEGLVYTASNNTSTGAKIWESFFTGVLI